MTTTKAKPLALAYVRVSTIEQADSGASLEAQRRTLTDEAERRGWAVEVVADEGLSAKNMKRPGLQSALDRLDKGDAQFLLSTRIDRVSRSVSDFAGLMDRATRKGWGMVMLSPNVDTSDPAGRFTSNVLASAAQYERELIGMRTKEGMAQRRAEGVHVGRRRELPAELVHRIVNMQTSGSSLRTIGATLEAGGVTTARGGTKWHASTIKAVLASTTAKGQYLGDA
ncbi:recombinase family protein [Arthrobacter roseus]|uniref:recombinase family protein n=1 Tax=Arthrobacter roseus TaxID=136274 RepID=UPI001966B284|nr:recombinase family protein [Arthrobacter roseus]MBM7848801.1 DNA invertase Pin-like site-specific DNA recombinase [Arthrobacter roseus]